MSGVRRDELVKSDAFVALLTLPPPLSLRACGEEDCDVFAEEGEDPLGKELLKAERRLSIRGDRFRGDESCGV